MLTDVFPMGPFVVRSDGRLDVREPGSTPGFTFVWRNRSFSALLADRAVTLVGVLGQVPSSATAAARREAAFALLDRLPEGRPGGWSFSLTPEHRLEVAVQDEVDWPATTISLFQPVVKFILAVSPYLDLLEEAGF